MAISGACALLIGLFVDAPAWVVLAIGLVWGFTVVADSAQFSTLVTEHADQAYVGTALTMQLAVGFTLTVATIWLLPFFADARRLALGVRVPRPRAGARRRRDAAAATLSDEELRHATRPRHRPRRNLVGVEGLGGLGPSVDGKVPGRARRRSRIVRCSPSGGPLPLRRRSGPVRRSMMTSTFGLSL